MKPARILTHWSPVLINGRTVILAGIDRFGEERTSTTIAELDIEGKTATTVSGRPYQLRGGHDPDYAAGACRRVISANGFDLDGTTIQAVTLEAADKWLRRQGAKPVLDEESRAIGEDCRRRELWSRLLWQRTESHLSDSQFAEASGLPVEVVSNLNFGRGSISGLDLDDVERALDDVRDRRSGSAWRM